MFGKLVGGGLGWMEMDWNEVMMMYSWWVM